MRSPLPGAAAPGGPAGLGLTELPTSDPGGAHPTVDAAALPSNRWSPRAYTTDPLDAALELVMGLGSDRPDNAQLLAQAGPKWLGSDTIDGVHYDIFSGPHQQTGQADSGDQGLSPLTYWIDDSGNLARVRMQISGLTEPVIIDILGRRSPEQLPETPWLQVQN